MTAKMPLNWDWLRDLLALARAGSIETAARLDGVDPTTLLRRLRRLEKLAGRRLLVRKGRSLILSSGGHDFVATAEAVEREVLGLNRRMAANDSSMSGIVRLTGLRSILNHYVVPNLATVRTRHPELLVELIGDARNLSLSQLAADVAIRLARPVGPDLVARRLANLSYCIYGPKNGGWITYDESLSTVPEAQWVAAKVPSSEIILRANGIELVANAVRAGLGQALLPSFAAKGLSPQGRPVLQREAWLVLHTETRNIPRIRVVADWILDVFAKGKA